MSTIGSVTYDVAKHLTSILAPMVGTTEYHVKDSKDFVQFARDLSLADDETMVSFDVTLRKKITPENWVIASAKSVLLSRVLLLKKNGYFYPNRVPIPEYSGFVDTVRYFFYSGFLVSATPFFRVHSFVGYNYTNISGLATLLQV